MGCFFILLIIAGIGWWLWTGPVGNWFSSEPAEEAAPAEEAPAVDTSNLSPLELARLQDSGAAAPAPAAAPATRASTLPLGVELALRAEHAARAGGGGAGERATPAQLPGVFYLTRCDEWGKREYARKQ